MVFGISTESIFYIASVFATIYYLQTGNIPGLIIGEGPVKISTSPTGGGNEPNNPCNKNIQ